MATSLTKRKGKKARQIAVEARKYMSALNLKQFRTIDGLADKDFSRFTALGLKAAYFGTIDKALRALEEITPEKLAETTAKEAAQVYQILVDKAAELKVLINVEEGNDVSMNQGELGTLLSSVQLAVRDLNINVSTPVMPVEDYGPRGGGQVIGAPIPVEVTDAEGSTDDQSPEDSSETNGPPQVVESHPPPKLLLPSSWTD